jgi:peptidoglycan hydrolase CwlO-like protein
MADFADQFTRLESENVQLRKTIKTSADQVLEANKLAADAQNENILLKDELKKLKQKMKDEQDARREAAITNLLSKFLRACYFSNAYLQIAYLFSSRCCRPDHQPSLQA